jgi:outer membrane cobalamin receptor
VIDSTAISGQSASATAADTSAASADSATAAAVDTAIVSGEAATVTDTTGVSGEGVAAPERQSPPGTRPYKVEEVVVTASRLYAPLGETPAGVTVIDRREIEANSEKNLISLLSKKESVNPGSYGSFGALELISLRGARSGRTPVVLDGIVLNNAQNGDLDFNTIPATLLERIEIVRGPLGSIQGGNGVAGIVNLVTAEPERGDKPVSVVGTSSGDLAYRKHIATFARKLGRAGMLLGIEDAGSDGEPPYKSYVGRNYFGKLDYVFGKRSNVDVLMMSHSDDLKTLSGSTQKTKAKRVQVTGEQLLREKTRVRFGAFGSDEVTDYVEPFFNTVSDLERYGGLLDVAVDGTSLGDVVCGGGFVRNALSCKDPVTAWSPATREGYVFGGARIKAGEWLKSLVTLRMDFHSQFGNELSPYGSLYHERPNGMVWFSFGRGFNPPTMNDLFWPTQTVTFGEWSYVTSGNERLSGETIWMGELGSRFNFLGGFVRGGATCFASRTEDYIQWVSSVSFADQTVTFTPANTAQVDARGAELAVDFSRKGMPLVGANLTLQRVEDQTGAKLPYMPESRLNLWYSQSVEPFPELEVNLRVDATSVGKSVEPLGSSQGSFFLVEGKLSGTMAGFTAFARLRNATDAEYPSRSLRLLEEGQPARYYPMPGRNYEIGLLWKLLD